MQIYNEDCFQVMDRLNDASIDIIITSPPYNIGIEYEEYDDNKPYEEYLQWITEWVIKAKRILKSKGSLFINIGSKPTMPWISMDVANVIRKYLILQNNIVWVKSIALNDEINFGHIKPINSKRFLSNAYESIYHFTKTGNVEIDRLAVGIKYADKSNINRWNNKIDKRCRGNVWYIPYPTIKQKRSHPAIFPEQLVEMCIKLHGTEINLVMDPFMGIGTTLSVCKRLGIDFIGCEIDKKYFNIVKYIL